MVDRLCEALFLTRSASQHDDNLIFVRERLLRSEADIAGLLELLRKRPGVFQATIFGEAIHALVAEDRTPAELGLDAMQVRPAEPSLEDVFVALSRAQGN